MLLKEGDSRVRLHESACVVLWAVVWGVEEMWGAELAFPNWLGRMPAPWECRMLHLDKGIRTFRVGHGSVPYVARFLLHLLLAFHLQGCTYLS